MRMNRHRRSVKLADTLLDTFDIRQTMKSIQSRIEKIEKKLNLEDKTEWLRIPDPNNPGQTIEIKGCRTLAEFLVGYRD